MTNTINGSDHWAAEVARLQSELATAEQDIALLLRLKSAEASAKRLREELATATAELAKADADAEEAARKARLSPFHSITITDTGLEDGTNLLGTTFRIAITRLVYDAIRGVTEPQTQAFLGGLQALPPDALEYLVRERPEAIPGRILALAPGDPEAALDRYFVALRKGYVSPPFGAEL
jgi:hypothetical protein